MWLEWVINTLHNNGHRWLPQPDSAMMQHVTKWLFDAWIYIREQNDTTFTVPTADY